MSLAITITFNDSANGSTTDTFSLNDADAATLLTVLATANAPGQRPGPRQQQQPQAPVVPLAYDVLYHQIANNFWLGLQSRVQNIQLTAAQTTAIAQAQAAVKVLTAASQAATTPMVVSQGVATPAG